MWRASLLRQTHTDKLRIEDSGKKVDRENFTDNQEDSEMKDDWDEKKQKKAKVIVDYMMDHLDKVSR